MSYINNNQYFPDLINTELKKHGLQELDDANKPSKIFYCDISYGNRNNPSYHKCEIVNQLANVDPLGNKKQQYELNLNYYKERPKYIPQTISFTLDEVDNVRNLFLSNPRESPKVFILKPENALSRQGVGIVRNYLELVSHLDKFPQFKEWIIQDYIDNPLIFNNKKFHFRIYVIYMQTSKFQVAYLGKRGFIYTANKEFESGTFDPDIVLSGENSKNNVFYIPDDFIRVFGKEVWESKVWPQIVKITRETLKSTLDHLQCPNNNKQKCFKILGYDILINDKYECYLAEINARNVSYKYPNEEFRNSFYKTILKLVLTDKPLTNKELKEKTIPYERILFKEDGVITEGFNGIVRNSQIKEQNSTKHYQRFNFFYWNIFFPILIITLIVITIDMVIPRR